MRQLPIFQIDKASGSHTFIRTPRKPRIEASDANYYGIILGNYRSPVFKTEGTLNAFQFTLYVACERFTCGSQRTASRRITSTLGLSTSLGNLSVGMRRLNGIYATRFNRFRKETGHLLQANFRSLTAEAYSRRYSAEGVR